MEVLEEGCGRADSLPSKIAHAVQLAASGVPLTEVCRKFGISQQTLYRWRRQYGDLMPSEVQRCPRDAPAPVSAAGRARRRAFGDARGDPKPGSPTRTSGREPTTIARRSWFSPSLAGH